MNLVGDYGSSDEENDDTSTIDESSTAPISFPSSSSRQSAETSKKVTKMPYLPPDILKALANDASDSDDDAPIVAPKRVEKKKVTDDSCKLLGMLPPPKQSSDFAVSVSMPQSTSTVDSGTKKSSFNFSYTTTETSKSSGSSTIAKAPALGAAAIKSKPPAPVRIVAEELKYDVKTTNVAIPSLPKVSSSSSSSFGHVEQDYVPGIMVEPQAPLVEESFPEHDVSAYSNKKKRERDLEHQLMSGDLSGIDSANLASARGVVSWDASKYIDQQRQDYNIMKEYTGGSMYQPTKTQNKRHQLSSLAVRAAETEIAMRDAKGVRLATKRETQAKYGW